MHFPDFLNLYRKKAEKLLPKVGHIEFSGETYQVQITDPHFKEDVWAFLQLEPSGDFKDGFCSCEETEDVSRCVHLATAYLRVYNDSSLPLHQRFKHSLWNVICSHFADKLGYETDLLTESGSGSYRIQSIFQLKGKTKDGKDHLENLLYHRHSETEETSLKFSNLPQEEIQLWKEGRPSPLLRYELSFWNDLAKWLMLLQDSEAPYTIKFDYGKSGLPNAINIQFKEVELRFALDEEDLLAIIPSLATVTSPLKVHTMNEETIEKMSYDEESHTLEVQINNKEAFNRSSGISIGGWMFVPGDGFFAREAQGVLFQGMLKGEAISRALEQYPALVASKLKGTKVHPDQVPVNYEVHFDDNWNLHIEAYLFKKGDLKNAPQFGSWVYLKGFYRTEGLRFNSANAIIHSTDVGDFVTKHRAWLANFPGLETHLASIEGQLTYSVSPENHLSFASHFQNSHEIVRTKDFGTWIFIEGQGFYSKVGSVTGMPLRPGIALDKEQIAPFIRMNREELKYVPGFFSEICPIAKAGLIIKLTDDEQVWVQPHYELEETYKDKTIRFFDDFTYVADEGFYQLPAGKQLPVPFMEPVYLADEEIPPFISQEVPRLKERYSLVIDPRLHVPEELYLTIASVTPKEKGWYSLKLAYKTENGSILITDIWEAMHAKKRFFFDEAGLLDLHHSRYHWIRKIPKNRIDKRSNTITLSTMDVVRLTVFDEVRADAKKEKEQQEVMEFLQELQQFEMPRPPDLTGLKSDLRPYQEIGVQWLWFLYSHNLSGLLCDDMGLGKTHQAMALMTAIRNENEKKHPFIVICPTSVIYHWEDKLKDYLPDLKVCTFYGSKRTIPEHYDVLLTSYGVWRMESKVLKKIPFSLAILDEIQMAKNENSRLHASLLSLDAYMKLGLTGTPIENDLEELKALFDITLPNYMPGTTEFRELFVKPIEREKDVARKQLLNRFIKPFILRRKKSEVLTDLPEKTEEVYHCGLLPEQQVLYNEVLDRSRRQLMQELADNRTPIPYIHIFAILSSLKQICDHPAVYLKRPESYKEHRSGKWDLFLELLSEARESKQKVVVYSQYLHMLDIIEEYLNEMGIGYATIRGATARRGEQLKKFNEDPNCEVFVGSLQASGLGVDLTAASVVIHYDRWWNAARENQATDRVHRIGQQRGVQVFKLVTKGTFEERIHELITSKGQLMEDVVGTDDQHAIKRLSRDEILELLKFTGS